MQASADFRQEREELDAILGSGILSRAPNLEHLLTYVCARYFEGAAEQIKEYNIAVDALGRSPDFDQKRDSIVRVEAHRLRKRLRAYYDAEGADHPIRIDIPPGQYAPQFLPAGSLLPSLGTETLVSQADAANGAPAPQTHNQQIHDQQIHDQQMREEPEPQLPALVPEAVGRVIPAVSPKPGYNGRHAAVTLGLLLISGAGAVAIWRGPEKKLDKSPALPPPPVTAGVNPVEVRILAGRQNGDYTDRLGRVWQSDRYFHGGWVFEAHDHPIFGTREPRIYQGRREGAFSYDIPLAPGVYELRLHFAETLFGENNVAGGGESSRVFSVSINGKEALHEFDVASEAGPSTADIRAFKDISPASDGKLHLAFAPTSNPPLLCAIEIIPGIPGKLRPIRMVALDRVYVDPHGRSWEPDRYARGGLLIARATPVEGTADPELFRGERFGNLRYVIPVPPGRYCVTLYFAELWFGPDTPGGGGVGSRIFDILVNGVAMRRGFDVYKEAHGAARSITWSAHRLEPDAQGKLNISLVPIRNYASVNAVEVLDESK